MYINSIINSLNSNNYQFNTRNKKQPTAQNSMPTAVLANYPIPFLGTPRVDKSMFRFFDVNEKRFPTTVKLYLES